MSADFESKLYDPNGELSEEELRWASITLGGVFRRCQIKPQQFSYKGCNTLVYGEMASKKYLVYVRVTHSADEEDGTGPMPLVLIDAANEIGAEPHVVRMDLARVGQGFGLKYWGCDELENALRSNTKELHSIMLKGKTVKDFLRLAKGKISRLDLVVEAVPVGGCISPEEIQLRKIFDEPTEPAQDGALNLSVKLLVDGRALSNATIDLVALAQSCYQSDEHYIFTCTCGMPECAGIDSGVVAVTENGFTVWKVYGLEHKHVFVFDHKQYRAEVLEKLKASIECFKKVIASRSSQPGLDYRDLYCCDLPALHKAIYELEQGKACD